MYVFFPQCLCCAMLYCAVQLHAGDIVRWRCSYDMSTIQPGSTLTGGFSSSPAEQQEQCTVRLQYWPRVEAMRGCSAALDTDELLGENMCSSEAEDLLRINAQEDAQFPMRCVCAIRIQRRVSGPIRVCWSGVRPGFLRHWLLSNGKNTALVHSRATVQDQTTYPGASGDTARPTWTIHLVHACCAQSPVHTACYKP
jgi:hypothetical protein